MDENKEKDFWNSSNDDFWKKPVITDDWLKGETAPKKDSEIRENSTGNKDSDIRGEGNPYTQDNPYAQKDIQIQNNSYSQETIKDQCVNPYGQTDCTEDKNTVYEDTVYIDTVNEDAVKPQLADKKKKRGHVHTIICLFFIGLAILAAVMSGVGASLVKKQAVKKAMQLSFKEEEAEGRFVFNENNEVMLDEEAYTVVSKDNFTGLPEGQKLIAVYAEVYSQDYISDSYALHDSYIGYEWKGKEIYKIPVEKNKVTPYVGSFGFNDRNIFDRYGQGNGYDSYGCFFFFVPEETEEITFYTEYRVTEGKIRVPHTVFYREMTVRPVDEEITRELAQRGEADEP